jgi:dienelactone hydrolase
MRQAISIMLAILASPAWLPGAEPAPGDRMLADYFQQETDRLARAHLPAIGTADQWPEAAATARVQLRDMLGLDPWPEKTDLRPVVTGSVEQDDIVVEKLHFQSRPGLYVTANLYRPRTTPEPLPAVLYLCGHSVVKQGNISFGNKVGYQHHGIWLARNGYVCLMLDSLQLGEIEGIHHGTYRYGMWWWINRGYTPAGVEAWNCVRALDYLATRPEVDATRLGVTGRSGGGAYSWVIAALDDRIRCAVPVAGITDLQNYVVDGILSGHCDCMFLHNTHGWDYPLLAAMVAPRPLLVVNTDADPIFPIDGVQRTFSHARRVYQLLKQPENCGLVVHPGGHKDLPELQIAAFAWLNRHLRKVEDPITNVGEKRFEPAQLRVFGDQLPADAINARIHETFVPVAPEPQVPEHMAAWELQRKAWLTALRERVFRPWPEISTAPVALTPAEEHVAADTKLQCHELVVQETFRLPVCIATTKAQSPTLEVHLLGDDAWQLSEGRWVPKRLCPAPGRHVYTAPRGVGPTAFSADAKQYVHLQRRFQLLGQTLDGQRVYDLVLLLRAAKKAWGGDKVKVVLHAADELAPLALYAALFERVDELHLKRLPVSHHEGPYLWNVSRVWDMPQAVAAAATQSRVTLYHAHAADWSYPLAVARKLSWPEGQLRLPAKPE